MGRKRQATTSAGECEAETKRRTQRRWTEAECIKILNYLLETIQKNEELEKPTADDYYKKLMTSINMEAVTVGQIKNKVRALRESYIKATEWRKKTGEGVMAVEGEQSVRAYLLKICPFWDILDEVYGTKVSITPPFIYETGQEDITIMYNETDISEPTNDQQILDNSAYVIPVDVNEVDSNYEDSQTQPENEVTDHFLKVKKQLVKQPKGMKRQKDSLSQLHSIQMIRVEAAEKKIELDRLRFDQEMKWKADQLALERDKFEYQKSQFDRECDLKLKEMEKEERLKSMEIEKEERIAKFKIEHEFKLQLEIAKLSQK